MKRFLVYDNYNQDHEFFDAIEEAKEYLKSCIQDEDGEYVENPECSAILELHSDVKLEVTEEKSDYESRGEEWPYCSDWSYVAKAHINQVQPLEKPPWIIALEIISEGNPISVGIDGINEIAEKGLDAYREQFES